MHNILKLQFGNVTPNIINPNKMNRINNKLKIQTRSPFEDWDKMKTKMQNGGLQTKKGGNLNMSSGLQSGLNVAGNVLGNVSGGDLSPEQLSTRESIRGAISSAGPIGAIIGAASGVVDAIGSATGLNLDNIDKSAAKKANIGGAASANNFFNSLPGVSMFVGMFGGKTAKSDKSVEIDSLTSAYGQSTGDIDAAQKLGNKRMLFGKGKANRFIKEQNRVNKLLTDIGYESRIRKSNSGDTYLSQNQNRYSGYTPQLFLSKNGMKFPDLEKARNIISTWSSKSKDDLQKFQLGGKMNLIPEGALHARKHNLGDTNPELKDQITNKGIPVVMNLDGGVTQTAEVEKDEWTLRKEFTDKLESLYKEYQKEQANDIAIEAGKLICYELLKNTDDRSGLIKDIK